MKLYQKLCLVLYFCTVLWHQTIKNKNLYIRGKKRPSNWTNQKTILAVNQAYFQKTCTLHNKKGIRLGPKGVQKKKKTRKQLDENIIERTTCRQYWDHLERSQTNCVKQSQMADYYFSSMSRWDKEDKTNLKNNPVNDLFTLGRQ